MTKVLFNIGQDSIYGVRGVDTLVTAKAATRRVSGDMLITRDQLRETSSRPFTLDLAATDLGQAWIITVSPDNGDSFSGYYKIPGGDMVNFTNLIEVDPESLEPADDPEPEWWAVARATVNSGEVVGDDLFLTRTDGVKIKAGNVRGLPGKDGKDGKDGLPGDDGVDGAPGENGISVVNTEINADGDLLIYLSNDLVVNAGRARGIDGIDGIDGVDGKDGVDGTNGTDGVDGAPGAPGKDGAAGYVAYYNSKLFTDPPSAYAGGLSVTLQTVNNSGWADLIPGASFVNIETFRHPSYGASAVQIITGYQTSDDVLVIRKAAAGDTWRAPVFYTSKSYVDSKTWSAASIDRDVLNPARIQKVSQVADGLMLKEDKTKLDGLVGTVHLSIPKNATDLPDSYAKGLTTFVLSGNQLGFPTTWAQVSTVKSLDGRAVQTIEPVSSSSITPTTIFKRFTTGLNVWSVFYKIDLVAV